MAERAKIELTRKMGQLNELVETFSSELEDRRAQAASIRDVFDESFAELSRRHEEQISQIRSSLADAPIDSQTDSLPEFQELRKTFSADYLTLRNSILQELETFAHKTARFCQRHSYRLHELENAISIARTEFEASISEPRKIMARYFVEFTIARSQFSSDDRIPLAMADVHSRLSRSYYLKSLSAQVDHLSDIDRLRQELTEAKSLALDEVQSTRAIYADECDIFRAQLSHHFVKSGLFSRILDKEFRKRQNAARLSIESLKQNQEREFQGAVKYLKDHPGATLDVFDRMSSQISSLARDRFEFARKWRQSLQSQRDLNDDLWLELNLNYMCFLSARSRGNCQAGGPSPSDLKKLIIVLERDQHASGISQREAARALASEHRVQLQELQRMFDQRIGKLRDHRNGLRGMLDERIDVLQQHLAGKRGKPMSRQAALTQELSTLQSRLGFAQEMLSGLKPSRSAPVIH
jgi:hypothetical protein